MVRIHTPRKLRYHHDGLPLPDVGDYLQLPTRTTYEILEVNPGRKGGWFKLLVWRLDPDAIPAGSRVISMHWIKRGEA